MFTAGARIKTDFERPEPELIKLFEGVPVSNINDMQNRLFCMRGLRAFNRLRACGPAFTVKVPEGDNLMFHRALDLAKPGDIIVVDGGGFAGRALCGGMMAQYSAARGIAGWVIDGAVRDTEDLENAPFPVIAAGVCPQGPYCAGPGEINYPVACGGQVVCPGDIIACDADGAAVIKPEFAPELAELAAEKYKSELEKTARHAAGDHGFEKHAALYLAKLEKLGIKETF